ncbi:hypothetical protein Rhal01_03533 [Rubritalea halochordaticola]|uniref:Uncharacterized protein n=2 Tax=Rubritalea halochordaticola TaxID=714537 RepID=A0ABP9V3Z6_9BACT
MLTLFFTCCEKKMKNSELISVAKEDRIYFTEGNPWPEGHRIASCELAGRIYEDGRFELQLFLESADYNENDGGEFIDDEFVSNWQSKSSWNNYHNCSIGGFLEQGIEDAPVSLDKLSSSSYHIDPLPDSYQKFLDDELQFNIYLLGHDAVADHHIRLGELGDKGYPIHWTAKVALLYSGGMKFEYSFALQSTLKPLTDIYFPEEWSDEKAKDVLSKVLKEHDRFQISTKEDGERLFTLIK